MYIKPVGLEVVAPGGDRPVPGAISRRQLLPLWFVVPGGARDLDVDARRHKRLAALQVELLDDQLGVSKIRLQLVAVIRAPDDPAQHLPLHHLIVALAVDALSGPLRFYFLLLLEDGLESV